MMVWRVRNAALRQDVNAMGTRCEGTCFSILLSPPFEDERASYINALSSRDRKNNESIGKHGIKGTLMKQ